MSDTGRRRRRAETRESIIQDRTDEILKSIYKDGQILRKHRTGDFSTEMEWLDTVRELADALLPSDPRLEAYNLSATEAMLLRRPKDYLREKLRRLDKKLNNSFGEGLEPEERDRIANLAIDAQRPDAEGPAAATTTQDHHAQTGSPAPVIG